MTPEEITFQLKAVEAIEQENIFSGGLLFPFLRASCVEGRPFIRAMLIPSKRGPDFVCFACLADKATVRRFNGIFFSLAEEELEKAGVEIEYGRIRASIKAEYETDLDGNITGVSIFVKPVLEEVEKFFDLMNALYVRNANKEKLTLDNLREAAKMAAGE